MKKTKALTCESAVAVHTHTHTHTHTLIILNNKKGRGDYNE